MQEARWQGNGMLCGDRDAREEFKKNRKNQRGQGIAGGRVCERSSGNAVVRVMTSSSSLRVREAQGETVGRIRVCVWGAQAEGKAAAQVLAED